MLDTCLRASQRMLVGVSPLLLCVMQAIRETTATRLPSGPLLNLLLLCCLPTRSPVCTPPYTSSFSFRIVARRPPIDPCSHRPLLVIPSRNNKAGQFYNLYCIRLRPASAAPHSTAHWSIVAAAIQPHHFIGRVRSRVCDFATLHSNNTGAPSCISSASTHNCAASSSVLPNVQ
mgnify:CR=1 FL=1